MEAFTVPKFDLHIHGGLVLRLRGGVTFQRQGGGSAVLIRNHAYTARLIRLGDCPYPLLVDEDGVVGVVPRLPAKIRRWLGAFH
jgi:hypothetical protein